MKQKQNSVGKMTSFLAKAVVLGLLFTVATGTSRAQDKTFPGVWKAKSESINGKSVEASKGQFKFRKDGTGLWAGTEMKWKHDAKEDEITITGKTIFGDSPTIWLVKWLENGKEVRLRMTAFGQAAELILARDD